MVHVLGHNELIPDPETLKPFIPRPIPVVEAITGANLALVPSPIVKKSQTDSIPSAATIPVVEPAQKEPITFESELGRLESTARAFEKGPEALRTGLETPTIEKEKQILEINKQIKMLQAEELTLKDKAEAKEVLDPFAVGAAARAQRALTVETLKLSAQAAALQGEIVLADRQTERAITAKYFQTEEDLRVQRDNILANWGNLTQEQKRRASATLQRIDKDNARVVEQKATEKGIEEWRVKAAASGKATNQDLAKFDKFTTEAEAAQFAAPFLAKPADITAARGSVEEFKVIVGRAPRDEAELNAFTARREAAGREGDKPLSVLDVARYRELYAGADVVAGDTEKTANEKVQNFLKPKNLADEEFRTIFNNMKSKNLSYETAKAEIQADNTILNKERAFTILDELYGKKKGKGFFGIFGGEKKEVTSVVPTETKSAGQEIQEGAAQQIETAKGFFSRLFGT